MILKVRDEQDFNISMNLNINYELEYIELTVNVWNKKAHTQQTKTFTGKPASQKRWPTTASRRHFCLRRRAGMRFYTAQPASRGIPQSNAERTSFLIGRSILWQTQECKSVSVSIGYV